MQRFRLCTVIKQGCVHNAHLQATHVWSYFTGYSGMLLAALSTMHFASMSVELFYGIQWNAATYEPARSSQELVPPLTHTYTHAHTSTHTSTLTHTQSHTHTHTHRHTHTHTHTHKEKHTIQELRVKLRIRSEQHMEGGLKES